MFDTWFQMQQQFMNNWTTLAQQSWNGFAHPTYTAAWRDMVLQSLRQMSDQADPTARDVIERLYASQTGLMRLMELSIKTWQKLLPRIQAGQDWLTVFQQEMETIRAEMLQEARVGLHVSGSFAQLWQAFLQEGQTFYTPWMNANQQMPGFLRSAVNGDTSAWLDMTSLYWDAYRETFGQLLQTPGLGYTREIDEKLRRTFAAWLETQQALLEYQVMLTHAWLKAFERLIRELAELAENGETIESIRDFLNRWSATADDVFKQIFRSPEYVAVQGKVVNTAMAYRQQQRQVNEMIFEMYDLPTRTEIDETHRRLHELRKEVKTLRRELAALKADKKPTAPRKARAGRTEE